MTEYWEPFALPRAEDARQLERMHLPDDVRRRLLAEVSLVLRVQGHDCRRTSYRGFLLFEGEPGTGKSTTAVGLADVLARTQLERTGKQSALLLCNPAGWSSDRLGEGPKKVRAAMRELRTFVRNALTVAVIDEVENVAASREVAQSKPEPTDTVRSVNVLLQELDALAREAAGRYLLIATTNLAGLVDRAVRDRADGVYCFRPLTGPAVLKVLTDAVEAWTELGEFRYGGGLDGAAAFVSAVNERYAAGEGERYVSARVLQRAPQRAMVHGNARVITGEGVVAAICEDAGIAREARSNGRNRARAHLNGRSR